MIADRVEIEKDNRSVAAMAMTSLLTKEMMNPLMMDMVKLMLELEELKVRCFQGAGRTLVYLIFKLVNLSAHVP
ncbi:hypothetical protein Leryth_019363 [Lithospermum erythrorhizon]|nr:hypothetical protein Leryth_019363 [Lithospermum erythrorhizon]